MAFYQRKGRFCKSTYWIWGGTNLVGSCNISTQELSCSSDQLSRIPEPKVNGWWPSALELHCTCGWSLHKYNGAQCPRPPPFYLGSGIRPGQLIWKAQYILLGWEGGATSEKPQIYTCIISDLYLLCPELPLNLTLGGRFSWRKTLPGLGGAKVGLVDF